MEKVTVRVIKKPYRKHKVGETFEASRRDARIMASLKLVEIIPPADDVAFTPSDKLDQAVDARALDRPEAPLENVAHLEDEPKPKKRRSRKKKGE